MSRKSKNRRLIYSLAIVLLIVLLYPYTSFYYRKPIRNHPFRGLNTYELTLLPKETYRLRVNGLFVRRAKFQSSNERVCDVSRNGFVKANRVGRAVIKVTISSHTYQCLVRVRKE